MTHDSFCTCYPCTKRRKQRDAIVTTAIAIWLAVIVEVEIFWTPDLIRWMEKR